MLHSYFDSYFASLLADIIPQLNPDPQLDKGRVV